MYIYICIYIYIDSPLSPRLILSFSGSQSWSHFGAFGPLGICCRVYYGYYPMGKIKRK